MSKKKWYVVHTLSGSEGRAKRALEDAIRRKGPLAEKYFGRILLPEEEVVEMRNGKKRTLKRKENMGYLFVEVDLFSDGKQEMEILILNTGSYLWNNQASSSSEENRSD